MGWKSAIKKIGKDVVKSTFSPYNLVVPFVGGATAHFKQERDTKKAQEAAVKAEEQAIAAANAEFNKDLDRRRKNNAYSKVIYAGVLGDNGKIGLGGKKSLLGL